MSSKTDWPPGTWPPIIFSGFCLFYTLFCSNLAFPRMWTHSLTHSLSHILSWLPFSLDFIDQTVPVKQISTFSSTPFLSTEGIMTSFVRQINCIHPSFSSQRMLPVYFLLTNIDCTGPFLPVSYRISVHTQLKSVYDPFLMTITSHAC